MDWRQSIRDNKKRTVWVLITFLLLYVLIGLLLDWFFWAERTLDDPKHTLSADTSLHALQSLITFERIPYFTLGLATFALLAIAWTRIRSQRMLLIGTQNREITTNSTQAKDIQLFNLLTEMQLAAGLRYTPKLFVIETNTLNAFASGWNEKSSMIAVSEGLINTLTRQEMQAVIAHELSHIRNQDIKLMLTVTVLSNIMLLVTGILFNSMLYGPRRNTSNNNQQNNQALLWIVVITLRFVLPLITGMLILYLSRKREFMADAGAVEFTRDNHALARALVRIHADMKHQQDAYEKQATISPHEDMREESYIVSPTSCGIKGYLSLSNWFSTHPTLEARLKALGQEDMLKQTNNIAQAPNTSSSPSEKPPSSKNSDHY